MLKGILTLPLSILCLFTAVIIYGLFGSPTPDNPGLPEIIVGLLLIVSAGVGAFRRLRVWDKEENIFLRLLHLLFLIGIVVPTATGILYNNDHTLILRDLLAFSFLCLPLFIVRSFDANEQAAKIYPWILVFAGTIFSIRTLVPAFNIWVANDELLYLSNSPLVLFTAIFLTAILWKIYTDLNLKRFALSLGIMTLIGIIMAAMLLDVQRATVAAIALSIFVLWAITLFKTPRRIIVPTIIFLIIGFVVYPWLSDAAGAIYKKTSEVGLNMRTQEAQAVLSSVGANPIVFFFGTGWGGVFSSPAVGGLDVNYTHSLLTTMFLKGGVVLLTFTLFVCIAAIHQIFLIFQQDSGKGLALFWPFIIPVFLYASHKSLDFGLLLLLIGVWRNNPARLRPPA